MDRPLAERVVAITGASSGIGAATAVACARRRMRVGLFARREGRLAEMAKRIRPVAKRKPRPATCGTGRMSSATWRR